MESQKVEIYMMTASKQFPAAMLPSIRQQLLNADDDKMLILQSTELKSPMAAFLLNFFLGSLGAEYFYLGKTGLGVAKLLTCGGLGIWSLINLFTIMETTRKENYVKFQTLF